MDNSFSYIMYDWHVERERSYKCDDEYEENKQDEEDEEFTYTSYDSFLD